MWFQARDCNNIVVPGGIFPAEVLAEIAAMGPNNEENKICG
jgi:hypothetical protein